MVNVKKVVDELEPYVPGRSIEEIANKYGIAPNKIIKMGSNENPLGPSGKALRSIEHYLSSISQYPEAYSKDLIKELASYAGTSPANLIVGGDGADEIIDVLGKTLIEPKDEFIVPIPSYMYYEFTLKIHGGIPVFAKWDIARNSLDVNSVIDSLSVRTKIIFLCTPNNPTGGLIDKKDIITVLNSTNALVVVDEAYFEFAGVNNVKLLEEHDNLLILRTFSKVLGLAGMRIGYAISNPYLIQYMNRVKPVFSLTKLSQITALATLQDKEYIEKSTEIGIKSREFLYKALSKFDTLNVLSSKSNFLLVDVRNTGMKSKLLTEELLKRGIIVRDCSSFRGLDDYWIRVSVGTLKEDQRFIEILEEIIG
ncbi:MAG: histidinol-phosphate transaminase [Euryarchaeota archaeon]|nr:histidinol-phosphate transaminase [Euryarchaeota archaeon]